MYEQYTDKQIVEMLIPEIEKLGWEPEFFSPRMEKLISILYKRGYIRGQLGRSFIIGEKKANEKKAKKPVNTFKAGDKVKFLGLNFEDEKALTNRQFFPPVNTVGKVVVSGLVYCVVHWPKSTTSGNGVWGCRNSCLKKVTEHWVPANKDNVKVGSKVRFANEQLHERCPQYFPCKGTIGEVKTVCKDGLCDVQWPKGTTSDMDWWVTKWEELEVLLCE